MVQSPRSRITGDFHADGHIPVLPHTEQRRTDGAIPQIRHHYQKLQFDW
jgi:hypothetical protein